MDFKAYNVKTAAVVKLKLYFYKYNWGGSKVFQSIKKILEAYWDACIHVPTILSLVFSHIFWK